MLLLKVLKVALKKDTTKDDMEIQVKSEKIVIILLLYVIL